ncbi:OLC1v1036979C1 [Oldenlandia corymbosa var. corymbosa]|uniref:OLC1v1036979C1 n=1 Tax=Oldenlandia corymbosa var. corymbosa TaxID=529605 RepID=A0AAV1CXS3_OLDCO|nr:OLC1v1036979C1 [Oldenlandia corymbosa var. corymbosa]
MPITHSFCLSSVKQIPCPHLAVLGPQKIPHISLVKKPTNYCSFRPITFQRIPTKQTVCSSQGSQSATPEPIEELPPKLQEIVKLFQAVQDPMAKYKQLLFYGSNLKPLDAQYKSCENQVVGCISQIWVRAYIDGDDKNVVFEADSNSLFTKGLAALLVKGLSGRPVEEIVKVSPDFAPMLGLQQKRTRSRNDALSNILKLMQKKALQLYMEAEKFEGNAGNETSEKSRSDENENESSS